MNHRKITETCCFQRTRSKNVVILYYNTSRDIVFYSNYNIYVTLQLVFNQKYVLLSVALFQNAISMDFDPVPCYIKQFFSSTYILKK